MLLFICPHPIKISTLLLIPQITCLEAERLHQEDTLAKFKDTLQQQKNDNKELYDKLAALEDIEHQLSM